MLFIVFLPCRGHLENVPLENVNCNHDDRVSPMQLAQEDCVLVANTSLPERLLNILQILRKTVNSVYYTYIGFP